jgi:MerR family transcriptional regulator, thiopeptide resistance regulator
MYTVKQVAKLAGITSRTLHYYDEIGLLRPSIVGENGYRYYSDEAILRLQQVMFYRALSMPLAQIKAILDQPEFDREQALESHRQELQRRIRQMERLARTIERTLQHLKGENTMSTRQLFDGFTPEEEAAMEQQAMAMYDHETVRNSYARWRSYSKGDKQRILEERNAVYSAFVQAMEKGADSPEAQACVQHWREHMNYFWMPSVEQLSGLADLYNEDSTFKENFDKMDPELANFVREAVQIYVKGLEAQS